MNGTGNSTIPITDVTDVLICLEAINLWRVSIVYSLLVLSYTVWVWATGIPALPKIRGYTSLVLWSVGYFIAVSPVITFWLRPGWDRYGDYEEYIWWLIFNIFFTMGSCIMSWLHMRLCAAMPTPQNKEVRPSSLPAIVFCLTASS